MRTPSYKTVEETHKISVGMKPLSERDENLILIEIIVACSAFSRNEATL